MTQGIATETELCVEVHARPPAPWNHYLANVGGSVYHLAEWSTLMTDVLGHECRYLVASEGGEWTGILPLVRVKSRLFGDHLVSMPFLNGGGPLGTPEARAALAREAASEARRLGVDSLELRSREPVQGSGLVPTDRRITVVLPLSDDPTELWEGFQSKLRSNVRRAEREGVEMRYGASELGAFYDVFARNMRDLGTPVLPRRFFDRMAELFDDHMIVSAAYWNGLPIGGQISFVWGDELEMCWGSSLREYNNLKVTSMIHWEYMLRGIKAGCRVFNFGRCAPDSGTHAFKKRWGGEDEALPWLSWAASDGGGLPQAESAKYRLAVSAWQKLPLGIANRVGPRFSRCLP